MEAYHDLLANIIADGNNRGDRTGTGTRSCFGLQFRHHLGDGFPLLTTKRLPFKTIVTELLWFLKGDTNIKFLLENGCHIWTPDAYRVYKRKVEDPLSMEKFEQMILYDPSFAQEHGDLGPIYGKQWRHWSHTEYVEVAHGGQWIAEERDQIADVIESIKNNPEGRRHIVTAWNPAQVDSMVLPPCHCLFQFYVHDNSLSCHLYQRSADVFLGVPFNIASYALLTHILARLTSLSVGELCISFGDVHIYNNHMDQVADQLSRTPHKLPELEIVNDGQGLGVFTIDDFILHGYDPHPAIKAPLSVGS
jgi:thymidylate synthase